MSGIIGVFSKTDENVADDLFYALSALQHRGEEGCGVHIVGRKGDYTERKKKQLVYYSFADMLPLFRMSDPRFGVGHTLYESSGDVQPGVSIKNGRKMTLAMDGNILGVDGYADRVLREMFLQYIIDSGDDTTVAARKIMDEFHGRGAFNMVAVYETGRKAKLIALRGPRGIKPMVYGEDEKKFVIASESKALDAIGMKPKDFEPGYVFDSENGFTEISTEPHMHCGFEWIYFADPTSLIEGFDVLGYRMGIGRKLAERCPYEIDIMVPSPDSGRGVSMGFAQRLNIPYMDAAIIKNPGAKRTFQVEDPEERKTALRTKFHMNSRVINGKRTGIGDDSIVRGGVIRDGMIAKMRAAGATKVYAVISCAPLRFPCYRDPTTTNFAAQGIDGSIEVVGKEVAKKIGADDVFYPTIEEMKQFLPGDVCLACMDGKYPIDDKWLKH